MGKEWVVPVSHTLAVYKDLCMITICSHQYCFLVYFFFCQASFPIYGFEKLLKVSPPP